MSRSTLQIFYEMHTTEFDIELKDTRRRRYRTASGRLRSYFSFVFFPKASLVLASRLSVEEPDQQMLATLLFAALTKSSDKPYGGRPIVLRAQPIHIGLQVF